MEKKLFIGISGKLGSGKDTVAQYLIEHLEKATRIALADLLKEEVAWALTGYYDTYRFSELPEKLQGELRSHYGTELPEHIKPSDLIRWMNDRATKEYFRKILQWWGTEFRREQFGKNYWIDRLEKRVLSNPSITTVIIPDIRFPDEAVMVKRNNGYLIRVVRGEINTGDHPSETALDDYAEFDTWVHNTGTLYDLENHIVPALVEALKRQYNIVTK